MGYSAAGSYSNSFIDYQNPAYYSTYNVYKDRRTSTSSSSSYSRSVENSSTTEATIQHVLTDDGTGGFIGAMGTVQYGSGNVTVKVEADFSEYSYKSSHEDASSFNSSTTIGTGDPTTSGGSASTKGGEYGANSFRETFGANSLMVRYSVGTGTAIPKTQTIAQPPISIDLTPYTKETVVPGSVRFTWLGRTYEDNEGVIYDTATNVNSGSINYQSGAVTMTAYVNGGGSPASVTISSLWTRKGIPEPIANITFNTELSPIKPTGLTISVVDVTGVQLIATADLNGKLNAQHIYGVVDYDTGLVELQFGDFVLDSALTTEQKAEWWYNVNDVGAVQAGKIWRPWPVLPETLRYNAVAYTYLPLDADILGLDPVRLPSDGRVPIFRPGGFAVAGHTGEITATVSNAQTVNCGRVRLSRVRVIGNDGIVINTGYTTNLDAGTVTFTDVTAYSQPVTIQHRIEDMALVSDVQITGRIKFTRPLSHAYPLGSFVSSALIAGDLFARVSVTFDQATWNGTWSDLVSGSAATGTFNATTYPIAVTNRGALTERWIVRFTNTTAFEVIGENVGVIAVGNTSTNCAPLNPNTGVAYFTIPAAGWGSGWSIGNVLRFNTIGAEFPVWVVRTVQQGPETVPDDDFTLLIRGDVNA